MTDGVRTRAGPAPHDSLGPAPRRERWILLAIVLGAVLLRTIRLGHLSLAGDEETTTLAALALLEGWPPTLPGGLVYLRGLPFTFLEAGSVALFGWSEWSVRLVPALLAGPRVAATWWMARPLLGAPLALAAAALLAVAPADVQLSRNARMYSLFLTLDVALLGAVVHTAAGRARSGLAAASGVLAVLSHRLAIGHLPVPLAAALGSGQRLPERLRMLAVSVGMVLAYLWLSDVLASAHQGVGVAIPPTGPEPAPAVLSPIAAHGARLRGVAHGDGVWILAAAGVAAAGLAARGVAGLAGALPRLVAAMAVAACAAASPVAGGALLFALPPLAGRAVQPTLRRHWPVFAAAAAATLGWAVAALVSAGPSGGLATAARLLLGFPAPNWYELALAAPALGMLGLVGLVVASDRGGRAARSGPWLALIAATFAPPLVTGLAARAEPLIYQSPVTVPLLVAALLGSRALLVPALRDGRAILLAAALLTALALRPDHALRTVLRDHGPLDQPFAPQIAPDHRGAAAYLRRHARAEEWIAAEDVLQQHLQAGRSEVWLRRIEDAARFLRADPSGGPHRDIYVGALHAHDLDALRRLADEDGRDVVWLVTSGEVEVAPGFYRTPETAATLRAWEPLAWFVARDGATRVYRLEAGEPVPPITDGDGAGR